MKGVYHQEERALSENPYVALAIGEPRANQRHTGIFFRFGQSDQHEFLHLAWQCALVRTHVNANYLWVDPAIPQRRLLQVAAICDTIANANLSDGIPYSFGPPNDCFSVNDCKFLLGPTNTGLTCASFVLAVFHRAGFPLIRYGSWPPPDAEDIAWQRQVVESLTNKQITDPAKVTQAHIDAVRLEVGSSVRYRPEHVAAAALKRKRRPVRHRAIDRLGELIVRRIRGEAVPSAVNWWVGSWRLVLSLLKRPRP
jgi:hypothetical protein